MPRFNIPTPARVPDTRTHQGGEGFTRQDPRDELFLLALSTSVGEDTFYESGDVREKRLIDLVHAVTVTDPGWIRGFVPWLRTQGFMRSASVVIACEYVRAGGPNGRQVIAGACQRPDEPAEIMGYWTSRYGKKIPMSVKRGVADACVRLYDERSTLKYDGQSKTWRFGDVVELTHPKPQAPWQSALFRHLIDRRHGRGMEADGDDSPYQVLEQLALDGRLQALPQEGRREYLMSAVNGGWSWERVAGWLPGGMDAQAWEALIPSMGLMALVRNLRNFDDANISSGAVAIVKMRLEDPDEVRRSRQFPLRFLTAWKNVASLRWGDSLEVALQHSTANLPEFPGRTLVLIDVSGSMQDHMLGRQHGRGRGGTLGAPQPLRWEVATVFGTALAQRAEHADVYLFQAQPVAQLNVRPTDSLLRLAEQCRQYVGGGTDILGSLARTYQQHDRVVILTDEQAGHGSWHGTSTITAPVVTFNVAGYGTGVTPNERNWLTIGGLSDAGFGVIDAFTRRHHDRRWPWEAS